MAAFGLFQRFRSALLVGLLFTGTSGCGGGGSGDLKGKVTFNGKPLTSGTVQVFLTDGSTRTGEIGQDGSYQIKDVPAGEAKIGVSSPNPKKRYEELLGFAKTEEQKKAIVPPDPAVIKSWVGIPDALAQPGTSGLTATVKKGENAHDIALTGTATPAPSQQAPTGPVLPSRPVAKP